MLRMSEKYAMTGNGLQNADIPGREKEGAQPSSMRVSVRVRHVIYVEVPGLEPGPFSACIGRGVALPTTDFDHANPYTAEVAADLLQKYVDEYILKLPASVKVKSPRVRADRR
jgi:hypothetical protein